MMRVIDGTSCNTDAAVVVAQGEHQHGNRSSTKTLYRRRSGDYFAVDEIITSYQDAQGNYRERNTSEWFIVGDDAKASEWCKSYGLPVKHMKRSDPEIKQWLAIRKQEGLKDRSPDR